MVFTPERGSANQSFQIGAESTSALGVAVAANRSLRCFNWVLGPNADVQVVGAVGRKYQQTTIENSEWVDLTVDGPIDYNGIIYLLASAMGSASPVAHGASTTAKDWVYTPPVTGTIVPQTYTIQQGETATRVHQAAYGLITDFGYKGDRKGGFTTSGKGMAQPLLDGTTFTSTPTAIALAPMAGKHANIYLDSTSAALGTTQLLKVLNIDYSFGGIYGGFYPINRANLGYTSHVDLKPGTTFKILMEADATGMTELSTMQTGSTQFLRVNAQGLIIDNLQTVTIGGGATTGTFTLSYKGQTTAAITYSAGLTSATVNTAFQLLSTVLTNCTVSGSAGGPYIFTFSGTLASDMSPVIATNVSLSGGTPTITSVAQAYNVFQHDMAVKVSKPNPFSDSNGVFAIGWDFTIVEDSTWGKAQTFLVTNLLTAL
jgi:hypothetical protein